VESRTYRHRVARTDLRRAQVRTLAADRCAEQVEVVLPVPVRSRIPMHRLRTAGQRSRSLVVADDVAAIARDVVLARKMTHEVGGVAIHLFGVPLAVAGLALVLDADGMRVDVPVAGLPADVLGLEMLRDVPVLGA